jgi:hypothetical protein
MWTTGLASKRLALAVAVCTAVLALGAQAALATPTVVVKRTLAPGVKYRKIRDSAIPVTMYVLRFRSGTKATLDGVLSSNPISSYKKTSEMAVNAGAIAAINGDLNDWPGRPTHQYVSDGMVMQTARPGVSFAFRQDEKGATIGRHPIRIYAKSAATAQTVKVNKWNSGFPRTSDSIVGYSWYGGKNEHPTATECNVRLTKPAGIRWNNKKRIGTDRVYTVDARRCDGGGALSVASRKDVVLSSKLTGTGATFLKSLPIGSAVRVSWANRSPGAVDIVSGNALILSGGTIQYAQNCSADKCSRNPRTSVGVTKSGRVIMLCVDGRTSTSIGFTLYQLGKEMKALGAVDAVNLDGGGSTTMWLKGRGVVNHPTDSTGERSISNAIVILPGADKNERRPLSPRVAF